MAGQDTGILMKQQPQNGWAWVLGAATVVIAMGLYLWLTEPTDPILPKTYTVM